MSIYAIPRATEDIDLLIGGVDLDRALAALQAIGFRRAGQPMVVAAGRMQIQRPTKIDGSDLLPLDLLIPVDPALQESLTDRTVVTVEDRSLSVIGLRGLRTLERLRGSAQDRADLEALGPQ